MRPNTSRVATVAAALFASTVSASFSAASSTNVAVYWGQGSDQIDLSTVCSDDSVDIVNIAFVNGFPKAVGDYPATNFANACGDSYYSYPNGTKSGLLSNCPGIGLGIKACQANNKKVLLSLGGGWPTDYYLASEEVAKYFAEFLWGAFGPQTAAWLAAGKPRPFGDASVDGFDLDIESIMVTPPFPEYQYANYGKFVKHLKDNLFPTGPSTYYISGAPQCVIPDARLADAISTSSFDFIFVQFYNTPECSSRAGYNGLSGSSTTFTFDAWASWLKSSSANPNVKLYLGMPAGEAGAPSDTPSYLTPKEANELVSFYAAKHPDIFGGVMLWEATVSVRNQICSKGYATWIKDILIGKYSATCASSSSSIASSTSTSSVTSSTSSSVVSSSTISSSVVSSSASNIYSPTSSAISSSVSESSTAQSTIPYPTGGNTTSSTLYPTGGSTSSPGSSAYSSLPYPTGDNATSSTVYPTASSSWSPPYPDSSSSSSSAYPTVRYPTGSNSTTSGSYPTGSHGTSTPCTTSTPGASYPTSSPSESYPIYPASTSAESHPAYPASSSSADSSEYPLSSKTPCSTSDVGDIITSSSKGYQGYTTPSSSKGYEGYPVPSSSAESYPVHPSGPTVTDKPSHPHDKPPVVTVTTITTTYVDICPTGLTTITTTIAKTVCPVCTKPPGTTDIPEGWYTTVTVCGHCGPETTTVTLTKPIDHKTKEYPAPTYPAYPEYSAVPVYPSHPVAPAESYPAAQTSSPVYVPEKPEDAYETAAGTVVQYITLTKVAAPYTHTPALYAPANSTEVYAPTGAASGTGSGSYPTYAVVPFEGASSRFSVSMSAVVLLAAGLLAL